VNRTSAGIIGIVNRDGTTYAPPRGAMMPPAWELRIVRS
jgi:hypothetical protein